MTNKLSINDVKLLYQRAIFVLVTQETRDVRDNLINGSLAIDLEQFSFNNGTKLTNEQVSSVVLAVNNARKQFHQKFEEDWVNEEGTRHLKLFDKFFQHISASANIDRANFAFNRPTCGVAESFVAAAQEYTNRCRSEGREVNYITLDVNNINPQDIKLGAYNGAFVVITDPNSPNLNAILSKVDELCPDAEVVIDISELPIDGQDNKLNLNHKCVKKLFFSVNHHLGLDGDYIGLFLQNTMGLDKAKASNAFPPFFGHQWFMNYSSVIEGEGLLEAIISGEHGTSPEQLQKAVKNKLWDGNLAQKLNELEIFSPEELFRITQIIADARQEIFTSRKDVAGETKRALDTWEYWTKDTIKLDTNKLVHSYITNGASEGIRNVINEFGIKSSDPVVCTFSADYEGFKAYAHAAHVTTKEFNRNNWHEMIADMAKESEAKQIKFCFTQPSSIDGKVWPEFDEFMKELSAKAPKVEVMLDLTYIGCSFKEFRVDTSYPVIKDVVFSLSKPAGMYYDRIGGIFTAFEYPQLEVNARDMNPDSALYAREFMERFSVRQRPLKYKPVHDAAAGDFNRTIKLLARDDVGTFKMPELAPSDVIGIASATQISTIPSPMEQHYTRHAESGEAVVIRANSTPAITMALNGDLAQRTAAKITYSTTLVR